MWSAARDLERPRRPMSVSHGSLGLIGASRLARATALSTKIAREEDGSPLRAQRHIAASRAYLSSTGVATVVLARSGEPPSVVVKLPLNESASIRLAEEAAALSAVHADRRLGHWRQLVPRILAAGTYRGQRYRMESAILGESVTGLLAAPDARHRTLRSALDVVAVLHEGTAQTIRGHPELVRKWVDVHVCELIPHLGRERRSTLALERIGAELGDLLAGATFSAGRIHGDYWPGNLLFTGPNAPHRALAGVVDWDASATPELPLHDVLHLLFYTRKLLTGRELGEIICQQLLSGRWSGEERALLARYPMWFHDGPLPGRHALLLYWLRQAAMHTRQQGSQVGWRYRLWQRRNVLPVLESLWA